MITDKEFEEIWDVMNDEYNEQNKLKIKDILKMKGIVKLSKLEEVRAYYEYHYNNMVGISELSIELEKLKKIRDLYEEVIKELQEKTDENG